MEPQKSIVEEAYGHTRTLMTEGVVKVNTRANQELSMTKEYFEFVDEDEPDETIIVASNETINIELRQSGHVNTGLLHSFIVGLMRNL